MEDFVQNAIIFDYKYRNENLDNENINMPIPEILSPKDS